VTAPSYCRALTIAGSDSGGGAGIQADLKTFAALGCYGMSAITALTAQNTCGVTAIYGIPAHFVEAQIDAVLADIGADAIKVGMLGNAEVVAAVAGRLRASPSIPVVVDPVMVAKGGDRLLRPEAVAAVRDVLLPVATVVTPNLPEAETLLERTIATRTEMEVAARALVALGPRAAVVKGGHLEDGDESPDCLAVRHNAGVELHWFSGPRVATVNTHGTGCTFSAAIAAQLAAGIPLIEAVAGAKAYLVEAIAAGAPYRVGQGHGPVHHFHALWHAHDVRARATTEAPR
jgi:hydroxymethylpyrimidine/phosphomethylpyrimidine kinase